MKSRIQNSETRSQNSETRMCLFCILASVFCILFLIGCQQGAPPQPSQPAVPQAKKEAQPQVPAPVPAQAKEEKKEEVPIDIKQKNPFKPFIVKITEKMAAPKTPLQKYELEQLKLVAVIWGLNGSVAMIETPDGKGYSVKKGDLIGNRNGMVKRVEKEKIVVEERLTGAGGEIITNEFEIKLPLPKGEEEIIK